MKPMLKQTPSTSSTPLTSETRELLAVFASSTADKTPLTAALVIVANGDSYEPASFALPKLDEKASASKSELPQNSISLS